MTEWAYADGRVYQLRALTAGEYLDLEARVLAKHDRALDDLDMLAEVVVIDGSRVTREQLEAEKPARLLRLRQQLVTDLGLHEDPQVRESGSLGSVSRSTVARAS